MGHHDFAHDIQAQADTAKVARGVSPCHRLEDPRAHRRVDDAAKRSKARVEIDYPDLPNEVKESAASAAAREELRVLREELSMQLVAANDELAAAHRAVQDQRVAAEDSRNKLKAQ